jgi:trans-aconitate methyltransferase
MNPGEYEALNNAEEHHAWFIGMRDAISRILCSPRFALPPAPRILDAGCGTGANLRMLDALLRPSLLAGFDRSTAALSVARTKVPHALLWIDDLCDPAAACAPLDLVISTDVVCLTGIERARPGLERLVAQMRPGGLLMLNLPSFEWLRSEHDAATHIRERYVASDIERLLGDLGLSVEVLSYRVCLMFPAVVAQRLARRAGARRRPVSETRSDMHHIPSRVPNAILRATLTLENRALAAGFRWPWGSSVFAVGRKPRH